MTRRNFKRVSCKAKRHSSRGFTLAELLIVIAIIAIVATIGVVTAVGYINRSRYDTNAQHAISVYQAAQTAISKKVMNGSIDEWVRSTGLDSVVNTEGLDALNESAHGIASLTFNPKNASDTKLYDLLSGYFYDRSIFAGTMSVEFDIIATHDGSSIKYSANVESAFYCKQNSADNGWDNLCKGSAEDGLPQRDLQYRVKKSYVGYFNGTEASVVAPVKLPDDVANNAIFTLRNGETLDLTWSFFDKDPEHKSILKIKLEDVNDSNNYVILTVNEADLIYNTTYTASHPVEISDGEFLPGSSQVGSILSEPVTVNEQVTTASGVPLDITRKTVYGIAKVNVKKSGSDTGTDIRIPLAIAKVTGDAQINYPGIYGVDKNASYTSYTLSLDCLMSRPDYINATGNDRLTIERLFGNNPVNITAVLEEATNLSTTIKNFDAKRAVNDPIFYKDINTKGNRPTYFYEINSASAELDNDKRCVVNTLFGDLKYSGKKDSVHGSFSTATPNDAVITSYRHLSNIRIIDSDKAANFKVAKNLNWYEALDGQYFSQVRVFTSFATNASSRFEDGPGNTIGRFHSPAVDGNLKVVSFPAIAELPANQTLSSLSYVNGNDTDTVFSINNIQLRWQSFENEYGVGYSHSSDSAYGMICVNYGVVYNIYTDNLTLTFSEIADGKPGDNTGGSAKNVSFSPNVTGGIQLEEKTINISKVLNQPVGGLIGHNKGLMGLNDSEAEDARNTIRMSNCLVLCGRYWYTSTDFKSGNGGIVGLNEGNASGESSFGVLKVCGNFAVTGAEKNGGIIGYSNATKIGAKLVVDGSDYGNSIITLPKFKLGNSTYTPVCMVNGKYYEGGAIGYVDGASFTYDAPVAGRSFNNDTGAIKFANDYQIEVKLPQGSYIGSWFSDSDKTKPSTGIGGAIGCANNLNGNRVTMKVSNNGYIVLPNHANGFVGGAIGLVGSGSISDIYIDAVNGTGSRIGAQDGTAKQGVGPAASGGAIGRVNGYNNKLNINIENSGSITAYSMADKGEGRGAGGAVGSIYTSLTSVINVYNKAVNIYADTNDDNIYGGTGGAVGNWANSANNLTIKADSVIHVLNKANISAEGNVGGAIGCAAKNLGEVYAINDGKTISGSKDFVGGVVGHSRGQNSGIYQATSKSSASVSGRNFVGGAAGSLSSFADGGTTKLIVRGGTTNVSGGGTNGGYYVGGVSGEVLGYEDNSSNDGKLVLSGDSVDSTQLKVTGVSNVGGSVGLFRGDSSKAENKRNTAGIITMPTQKSGNRLIVNVEGTDDLGGAVGRMTWFSKGIVNNKAELPTVVGSGSSKVDLTVVLRPESHVKGTGNNVGGAIGHIAGDNQSQYLGTLDVSTVRGNMNSTSGIVGKQNVGGVIGLIENNCIFTNNSTKKLSINFSLGAYKINGTIGASSDSNVGGAIGYYMGTTNVNNAKIVVLDVNLGTSTVNGAKNVGGAIGKTDYKHQTATNKVFSNQIKTVMNGTISGSNNVGGAIGYTSANYLLNLETAVNGNISGASNVGGVIGQNNSNVTMLRSTIKGSVVGTGDCVGGGIGFTDGNRQVGGSYLLTEDLFVTITGAGHIDGNNYVGGVIGKNAQNGKFVKSEIAGRAYINGTSCIGGAIGLATGKGETYGNIKNNNAVVSAVISSDRALRGNRNIGGAIGQLADKETGAWPRFNIVQAEVNTGILYEQTSALGSEDDARIGGVIGYFSDSNAQKVILKGTGGTVKLNIPGQPSRSVSNSMLIAATGRSIGGIIGQIGPEGYQSNCRLFDVDASEAPGLCVISNSASDRIGGWIGSGFGGYMGLSENGKTYNVNNVKVVYSEGSEVGGFMGRADGANVPNVDKTSEKDRFNTYHCRANAKIIVTLNSASVAGKTRVGGAFGYFYLGGMKDGQITVNLNDHSMIGDFSDKAPLCYNAGGAIGEVSMGYNYKKLNTGDCYSEIRCPITINIDSTSSVHASATEDPSSSDPSAMHSANAGVGGAIGRIGRLEPYNYTSGATAIDDSWIIPMKFTKKIEVNSANPNTSVYSAISHAGGVVGVMMDGTISQATTNANVESSAADRDVGGFVGLMRKGSIENIVVYGKDNKSVTVTGNDSYAGGFVGRMISGTIKNSYTTYLVNSKGSVAGGFVGKLEDGSITDSFVGGHTIQGQYESGKGNVTGKGNVGGFAGVIDGDGATITNCYTTASVVGNGDNVGGFAGNIINGQSITNCYTTARIINNKSAGNTGAFGCFAPSDDSEFNVSLSGDKVLSGMDSGSLILINGAEGMSGVEFATAAQIKGSTDHAAEPYDSALSTTFRFKAVVKNNNKLTHYGDWPLESSGTISINEADVILYDADGNPADTFVFRKSGVTFKDISDAATCVEKIEIFVSGARLDPDNYTLSYRYNDVASPTDSEGHVTRYAEVIISAKAGTAYTGTRTVQFTITPLDISDAEVVQNKTEYLYTGASVSEYVKPEDLTVTLNGETLVRGIDYYLEYDRNDTAAGEVHFKVMGMGNYTGAKKDNGEDVQYLFTISGASIGGDDTEVTLIGLNERHTGEYYAYYTGSEIKPSDIVVRHGGVTLNGEGDNPDYQVSYSDDVTNCGTVTITITGQGNYSGTKTVTYTIEQATNGWDTVPSSDDCIYGNSPVLHYMSLFGNDTATVQYFTDSAFTNEVTDITEAPVGTYFAKITIAQTANYEGIISDPVEFAITPAPITEDMVNVSSTVVYDGTAQRPSAITLTYMGKTLTEGTDYIVTCTNNVNVGTATVTITGINNFEGTEVNKSYEITPAPVTASMISGVPETVEYTGSAIVPEVTVKFGDTVLTKDTDYTVTYQNNTEPGTATITVTGIGNFGESANKTFKIKAELESGMVALEFESAEHTGSEIKPGVTVTFNGNTLTKGTDYDVTYSNNIDAGNATVTIKGKGYYTGTIEKTFTITPSAEPGTNDSGDSGNGGNGGNSGNNDGAGNYGGSGNSNSNNTENGGNNSGNSGDTNNGNDTTNSGNTGNNDTEDSPKNAAPKAAETPKTDEMPKTAETPKSEETSKTAETPNTEDSSTAEENTKSTKNTKPVGTEKTDKTLETPKTEDSTKSEDDDDKSSANTKSSSKSDKTTAKTTKKTKETDADIKTEDKETEVEDN